jgi:hypothetical protein
MSEMFIIVLITHRHKSLYLINCIVSNVRITVDQEFRKIWKDTLEWLSLQ